MSLDPATTSSVLTAIGDWAGVTDPGDDNPRPYPDLSPAVRTAVDWLTSPQPSGAAWPKDGVVYPVPAGPGVTIRLMMADSREYGPRCSVSFERRGGGDVVPRITRAVADRLQATVAEHAPVDGELSMLYLPGDTYTWWAFGLSVTPSPGLVGAYRLTQSGAYTTIYEPGWRERVARLVLPAGWRPDHGREYR